ncbi:helix-turn-helix transcriptional regulator [Chitinophaga sedimenti]|uniref:helix-turn-helix domain-containing protein n=1 Tax=Chitinophaga sedimenti TaxID=2033606 RepID=UPI002003EC8F|nr:helix-turn-helix transcriptional regulator [Chitinophaga sedimenti]MCK7554273.1 helix-turn-helix transcriptional regulator [Chitinophaga sedimenti]
MTGTTLMFFSSNVPYTWEPVAGDPTGYFCIFKEGFFQEGLRGSIRDLPMFAPGGKPSFMLNEEQERIIAGIFEKMLGEMQSDYTYKFDLIRNYVTEIVHNALKMEPSSLFYQHPDANSRITAVFTELLERQFPIESPMQQFSMRSAKDYAEKMAVHVNHLNRAIKLTTGKTTTEHIAERLANEAKALLKHTDWNISEIGYCLGFEEPSHFNNFFKKQVAVTPSAYRIA